MTTKDRRRRPTNAPRPELARKPAEGHSDRPERSVARAAGSPTMAEWNWRTFPVFFGFALGGFIGLYLGVVVQAVDNQWLFLTVFSVFAIMLGFAFSRLVTRWMVNHNWVKPRARS